MTTHPRVTPKFWRESWPNLIALTSAKPPSRYEAGNFPPPTYIESLLQRITTHDPALQAWVTIDRAKAMDAALRREQELAAGDTPGHPPRCAGWAEGHFLYCRDEDHRLLPDLRRFCAGLRRYLRYPPQGRRGRHPGQGGNHRVRHVGPFAYPTTPGMRNTRQAAPAAGRR